MSVLEHDYGYEAVILTDPDVLEAARRKADRKAGILAAAGAVRPGDGTEWYLSLFGPGASRSGEHIRVSKLMEADAKGRTEIDKTLDLFLIRCAEDGEFYIVIRKNRIERTADGLVEVREVASPEEG